MRRFEPDRYYRASDEEMRLIATEGTLGVWRCEGVGPPYTKFGNRVFYLGSDCNDWLDQHKHQPKEQARRSRSRKKRSEDAPEPAGAA